MRKADYWFHPSVYLTNVSAPCSLQVLAAPSLASGAAKSAMVSVVEVDGRVTAVSSRHAEHVRRAAFRLGLVGAVDAIAPLGFGAVKRYVRIFEQSVQRLLGIHAY